MKTLITSLLFALSVAGSSTSFAQDHNSILNGADLTTQTTVLPVNDGKVDVVVGKTDRQLSIQIVDQQGRTLASKSVKNLASPSRYRFDLNELPDGVYELVITEGGHRQVSDIVLDTHTTDTYRTITLS